MPTAVSQELTPTIATVRVQLEKVDARSAPLHTTNLYDLLVTNKYRALAYAKEVLDRAMIPFTVIGSTALFMKQGNAIENDKITFAILEQHAEKGCLSMVRTIEPNAEWLQDGFRIIYHDQPITVKIMSKKFHTLTDPDTVWYGIETWHIPNPWLDYWNAEDRLDT